MMHMPADDRYIIPIIVAGVIALLLFCALVYRLTRCLGRLFLMLVIIACVAVVAYVIISYCTRHAPPNGPSFVFTNRQSRVATLSAPQQPSAASRVLAGIRFVEIPPGRMLLGSPPDEPGRQQDEDPREVIIAMPYWISVTEITERQYEQVAAGAPGQPATDAPAIRITWDEAVYFCWRLTAAHPGWVFRLPTEAEWEYACRSGYAGAFPPWPGGQDDLEEAFAKYRAGDLQFLLRKLRRCIWFNEHGPAPAGSLAPNAFGVHDMLGNVWEWCDVYDRSPPSSDYRPIRGGAWSSTDVFSCRAASRAWERRDTRKGSIGFRIVCTEPEPERQPVILNQ